MESEDSDHISLMINCPVMFGYDMFCSALALHDDMHTYGIREQIITINWCTYADISDSLDNLFIFRDFETAVLVQSPTHLCLQGLCTVSLKFTSHQQ